MSQTIIVWYRNDLRVHDHPALATAHADTDRIVPVFIFDEALLSAQKPGGKARGSNRNRFLLESLADLRQSYKARGGDLIVRRGKAVDELPKLAKEVGADTVYYTADFTPYALHRDHTVKQALGAADIEFRGFPGRLIVHGVAQLQTGASSNFKVFTPFYKKWSEVGRRELASTPRAIKLPPISDHGQLPKLSDLTDAADLSNAVEKGGETEGRRRLNDFLHDSVKDYKKHHNDPAADATSRTSAYLHFGCISPLEAEQKSLDSPHAHSDGAVAWRRQLCWRDFYNYVLFHYPANTRQEFQERYRDMEWSNDKQLLAAWQNGETGYPIVDAAVRQLNTEGWMHNRGRLIVGSFLTKDLATDWREGEAYFMRMLVDGDTANNNGNWQWISSVGVDPAPFFRRMYNPASQQSNYDPTGGYVRRYVPELSKVPDKYLAEPWKMPQDEQEKAGCIIGKDYPQPIVDHKQARQAAMDRYRGAIASDGGGT